MRCNPRAVIRHCMSCIKSSLTRPSAPSKRAIRPPSACVPGSSPSLNYTFPVLATLSDGEKAVVAALKASWSQVPHQRCQLHFLNNIAKGALEVDGRLRQHLRQELGDLAAVPQDGPGAPHSPADAAHTPPLRP